MKMFGVAIVIFILGLIAMAGFFEAGCITQKTGEAYNGIWLFVGAGALAAFGLIAYNVGISIGRKPIDFSVLPAGKYVVIGRGFHNCTSQHHAMLYRHEDRTVRFVIEAPTTFGSGVSFILRYDSWWSDPYTTDVVFPPAKKREQC